MVSPRVVFALVLGKILLSRMPFDIICVFGNLVTNPKIMHLHAPGTLALYYVIHNANHGGVVSMDMSFGLKMA
jgi:hypothetical protein